ncbi:MAG: membrane-associated phospholipid phosphatase [Cyclobacteriaceae bacterium]|jgi:membrane-associated phospholipid phosphatase
MKFLLKELSPFLLASLGFFLFFFILILSFEKNELHLFLNRFHSGFADVFFKNYTHIGDGIFPAIALPLVLVIYRKDWLINFLVAALTFILVPANVQFFKRVVFPRSPRPVRVLGEDALYLVPDVVVAHIHSFPSGHSATIFALFIVLAYIFRKHKILLVIFACLAAVGAYSRVYLSQHFMQDILAGSILGILCFLLARWVLSYPIRKIQNR